MELLGFFGMAIGGERNGLDPSDGQRIKCPGEDKWKHAHKVVLIQLSQGLEPNLQAF